MKYLITALLSVALIWLAPNRPPEQHIDINNRGNSVAAKSVGGAMVKTLAATTKESAREIQADVSGQTTPQTTSSAEPAQVLQGCDAYVPLLQQYDWDSRIMTALMRAESSCNPNAINTHNYDGVYDYGLLQLHGQDILDPSQNIAHAYAIWQRQGYRAWSTYNNGAYLRYL